MYFLVSTLTLAPFALRSPFLVQTTLLAQRQNNALKVGTPLPVHREMQKIHKEFKQKGGAIHVLGDLPEIIWNNAHTIIKTVNYYE